MISRLCHFERQNYDVKIYRVSLAAFGDENIHALEATSSTKLR